MFNGIRTLALLSFLLLSGCQSTQPITTSLTEGELSNGLTYLIYDKPGSGAKIQLRLWVKTGSLNETEDQAGYAHLLEHMAFNGSKHFAKNRIIELFEKSGLTFGQDLNAYTNFDSTVYVLSLPKDEPELLAEALLYLRDVLTDININSDELNKEKGVVQNEYLLANPIDKPYHWARFDDYIKGSDYQKHMPIGTLDSVQQATPTSVNAYYKAWYQPNNAKLLIAGDVDNKALEVLIEQTFAEAANQQVKIVSRPLPKLVLSPEAKIYSNAQSHFSQSDLVIELDYITLQNSQDLATALQQRLLINLINYRLQAANNLLTNPFDQVGIYKNNAFIKNPSVDIYVEHSQQQYQQAVGFVALEIARIKEHGFAQNEIDLQLDIFNSEESNLINRYANLDSAQIAHAVMEAWVANNTVLTLLLEQQAYALLFASENRDTINQAAIQLLDKPSAWSFAVPYQQPQPDPQQLMAIYKKESEKLTTVLVIKEQILTMPVITQYAGDQQIQSETLYKAKNITEWQLKNGLTVVLLPTDAEAGKIEMSLNAPGGFNALTAEQQEAAYLLIPTYSKSGLVGVDLKTLDAKFRKANAQFYPYIEMNTHGYSMSSINKTESLELLFSVLHSAFTDAQIDPRSFLAEKKQLIEKQQNFLLQPIAATVEHMHDALYPNNGYNKVLSVEAFEDVQQTDLEVIYQQLFTTLNGYQLTIVGDFEIDKIKSLILRYMATIPSGKEQQFATKKQSIIEKAQSITAHTYLNQGAYISYIAISDTPNQSIKEIYQADILSRIILQKLNQVIREQLSLTYSPQVNVFSQTAGSAFTQFIINIPTKKQDVLKTQQALDAIISDFLDNGFTQEQLDDHKKGLAYGMSTMLSKPKDIKWLLNRDQLFVYELNSTEHAQAIVGSISLQDMKQFMRDYANPDKMLKFVNYSSK